MKTWKIIKDIMWILLIVIIAVLSFGLINPFRKKKKIKNPAEEKIIKTIRDGNRKRKKIEDKLKNKMKTWGQPLSFIILFFMVTSCFAGYTNYNYYYNEMWDWEIKDNYIHYLQYTITNMQEKEQTYIKTQTIITQEIQQDIECPQTFMGKYGFWVGSGSATFLLLLIFL
jgi:hypothetical protein